MQPLLAVLAAASEASGEAKGLEAGDLLTYLAIIAAAMFFVILAGLGYFTPGGGNDDGH